MAVRKKEKKPAAEGSKAREAGCKLSPQASITPNVAVTGLVLQREGTVGHTMGRGKRSNDPNPRGDDCRKTA